MRKTRELDIMLNECLERLLQGETPEQCLERFPEHRDELRPLLETAVLTRRLSEIRPDQEFRALASQRFHSVLQETELKPQRHLFGWLRQPQWAAAVSVLFVLLLGGGAVMAAGGSMPDEPLYPVKLAVERARVALTPSALGKAELYASLADRRMDEIARMAAENKPQEIEQAAGRLDAALSQVALLSSTETPTAGVKMMAPAIAPAPTPTTPTAPPTPAAPLPAREQAPQIEAAPSGRAAEGVAEKKTEAKKGEDRRVLLKEKVAENAAKHSARLRELLQSAPESARPALQRALAISQEGYERALESLGEP